MAVAWIGNRDTLVERAVEQAAALLHSSRCPVFSLDTDIHGTRAAIALAERVGAAYDHIDGAALARETALFTDKGGMIVSPGEVRRRGDVIVIVGELPEAYGGFLAELAETAPDLAASNAREFFLVGNASSPALALGGDRKATLLSCGELGIGATLAALRAQCAGREVSTPVSNFDSFSKSLAGARFPVFLFSGHASDGLALETLQGLIADINSKSRASGLHLPASERGWGSTLASTWSTGFPMRTGFSRGFPEFDPWRFDVERMLAAGEADVHLRISSGPDRLETKPTGAALIVLSKTTQPVAEAAVTIAIGEPGVDHDAVTYSIRTGSLASIAAQAPSELPAAGTILRAIGERIPAGAA